MSKYDQVEHGGWMHLPRGGSKVACCDCGLVHRFQPKGDRSSAQGANVTEGSCGVA